jgi:hypothetical protein
VPVPELAASRGSTSREPRGITDLAAAPDARSRWEIVSAGLGASWPDLDEYLSLAGMLAGRPAVGAASRRAAE